LYVYRDEQYMTLYNGNAEVIGNFRALNFYKASDIRIKQEIKRLIEGTYYKRILYIYKEQIDTHDFMLITKTNFYFHF
jgi:hypothetical protein